MEIIKTGTWLQIIRSVRQSLGKVAEFQVWQKEDESEKEMDLSGKSLCWWFLY